MPEIDHNPFEKRYTNTVWWVAWIGVVIMWLGYFYFREPDVWSLALGGVTIGLLVASVNEMEENKKTRSRPRKPPAL